MFRIKSLPPHRPYSPHIRRENWCFPLWAWFLGTFREDTPAFRTLRVQLSYYPVLSMVLTKAQPTLTLHDAPYLFHQTRRSS